MDADDRGLLERIQKGDGESFGLLYDRTRDWLMSCVIVPRVGASRAEDVLAETYRTALEKIHAFEWRGVGLLHWLATIARRKAQEKVREEVRGGHREEPIPPLLDPADGAPTAEAALIARETSQLTRERVHATLAELPPRYASVLRMRLLEDLGRLECAERLAVTPATFDVVLYRATRAFAKKWSAAPGPSPAARERETPGGTALSPSPRTTMGAR